MAQHCHKWEHRGQNHMKGNNFPITWKCKFGSWKEYHRGVLKHCVAHWTNRLSQSTTDATNYVVAKGCLPLPVSPLPWIGGYSSACIQLLFLIWPCQSNHAAHFFKHWQLLTSAEGLTQWCWLHASALWQWTDTAPRQQHWYVVCCQAPFLGNHRGDLSKEYSGL